MSINSEFKMLSNGATYVPLRSPRRYVSFHVTLEGRSIHYHLPRHVKGDGLYTTTFHGTLRGTLYTLYVTLRSTSRHGGALYTTTCHGTLRGTFYTLSYLLPVTSLGQRAIRSPILPPPCDVTGQRVPPCDVTRLQPIRSLQTLRLGQKNTQA